MWWHVLRRASSLSVVPLFSYRMLRGCFEIAYKARFQSASVEGNYVSGGDVFMGI